MKVTRERAPKTRQGVETGLRPNSKDVTQVGFRHH